MTVVDIFLGIITNLMNLPFFAIFTVIGIFIGYMFLQGIPKNQVLYMRERDKRGHEYEIEKEDALTLISKTNPKMRFYKYGNSFVFTLKRRFRRPVKIARFLAKEGTAYSWHLDGFKKIPLEWKTEKRKYKDPVTNKEKEIDVKVPVKFKEKSISLKTKTQEQQIIATIGREAYEMFPAWYREAFKNNKTKITVGLESGLTPHDMPIIDEDTLSTKADEQMAALLARGFKAVGKTPFVNIMLAIGTGVAIGLALVGLGLLPMG